MRRRRSGQIVFLEFAATLPIFLILMIAARWFHSFYKQTIHAYAQARLGVEVRLDEHHSGRTTPNLYELYAPNDGRSRVADGLAAKDPAVNHFKITTFEGRATRPVRNQNWLGNGEAVGFHRSTRDCWTHFDIEEQVQRDSTGVSMGSGVESMPFLFLSPGRGDLEKEFLHL